VKRARARRSLIAIAIDTQAPMRSILLTSSLATVLVACGGGSTSSGAPSDTYASPAPSDGTQGAAPGSSVNANAKASATVVANANANADAGADANANGDADAGAAANAGGNAGAGAGDSNAGSSDSNAGSGDQGTPAPAPPPSPIDDPGPSPTASCAVTKDSSGFFTRTTANASYVGYVPASYDGSKAVRLIVALHGCGDSAANFATWGANPYDTRATQTHIGIALDGATGARGCWSMGGDDAKVLAAIDDAMSCFWIHKHEVVLAGFSSGGELGYRVAMMNASRFSGLLVESSAAYDSSSDENALFAGASWKFPIAHVQHSSDTTFPLASVQADWAKLTADGFPLQTEVTAGDHNGTSTDWAGWLIPHASDWLSP
jgi:predicted esterase